MTWKYHTPERDGHAPDDWDEGCEREYLSKFRNTWESDRTCYWEQDYKYRYRPLQDATYEPSSPSLLAQCLALPQDQREALIEAMQKPQRDWADDVWDVASESAGQAASWNYDKAGAAVIRSMCRPKEELQHVAYYSDGEFYWMSGIAPRDCELFAKRKDCA